MTKSISLLICLLFITTICKSQEFNIQNTSPGENTLIEKHNWETLVLQNEIDWRETSVGLFFMPKPLGINALEIYDENGNSNVKEIGDDFSFGFGASLNFDFEKSGAGFGNITYVAYILGDKDATSAFDIFTALKYDIKLGDLSRFELSPFVGLGNLSMKRADDILGDTSGSSLYFSGGLRITYLVVNNLFVGADIQTVPYVTNVKKLFEIGDTELLVPRGGGPPVETTVDDAKIQYAVPYFQVNLSIRYNIF
jgi:hypothetical protein